MKSYNCPDCLIENASYDPCLDCKRRLKYGEQNYWTTNPSITPWNYAPNITPWNGNVECRSCFNHPANGGEGNCSCTAGNQIIFG